ncbi:MAG: hypothetical protein EAX90_15830 [Candidatus Heimdallarchaeota archaeon]|nr:hypothetical protein [Candidatus Heimdallarchaeota archaeon]
MVLAPIIYVSSLFMIGRNFISLFFKIKDFCRLDKRVEIWENKTLFFTYIALIITAISGLVSGIVLLFPNLIFGYYLFIIVSGMMIYSYITYAGRTFEEKNWIMFSVCFIVIITIIVLTTLLIVHFATLI